MIVVIRAGGTGTRLWPVSRKNNPKQFADLIGDASLMQQTFERVLALTEDVSKVYVSVNEEHAETVLRQIPNLRRENVIVELSSRNTGPAICLEASFLRNKGIADDEVVATIPADDYIGEPDQWREMMRASERFLKKYPEKIITPGAKPDYLDTGYSFITAGQEMEAEGQIAFAHIAYWDEKPHEKEATELLKNPRVYYHMGMYVWTLGNAHKRLEEANPHVMKVCREILQNDDISYNRQKFSSLPKESIETLLTKDCPDLVIVTGPSIGWSDIGKWHVLKRVLQKGEKQNVTKGQIYAKSAKNSLVFVPEGKMVALIDLDDIVVVDTGDALLISSAEKSAEVKSIVEQLADEGKHQLL